MRSPELTSVTCPSFRIKRKRTRRGFWVDAGENVPEDTTSWDAQPRGHRVGCPRWSWLWAVLFGRGRGSLCSVDSVSCTSLQVGKSEAFVFTRLPWRKLNF